MRVNVWISDDYIEYLNRINCIENGVCPMRTASAIRISECRCWVDDDGDIGLNLLEIPGNLKFRIDIYSNLLKN